ncbi:MAG: 4a-hydroxytetrahydrobiopterin dehydratase, partial [Phycisphaerae bacterium]|nr:4a-hydroxytetrahydrobiopterin dehydratase [Phycisphaerae bacterium]
MQATELRDKTCIPCEQGGEPLKGETLQDYAEAVDQWHVVDDHHIVREFEFDNFKQALAFVNRVGELADNQGHHPNICFTWGQAQVKLYTHKVDGLSEADFV